MHRPLFLLTAGSVAAVGGLIVASAMPAGAATAVLDAQMQSSPCSTAPGDTPGTACTPPATTPVTFTITTVGTLSIAVPTGTVSLGSEGSPAADNTILSSDVNTGGFGAVTVIDDRALDPADWTATVSCSDFKTATSPQDTISATDATYATNGVAGAGLGFTAGDITDATIPIVDTTPTPTPLGLTNDAQTIVTETGYDGDNGATWSPTIAVHIPANAVVGVYDAIVTHSVS